MGIRTPDLLHAIREAQSATQQLDGSRLASDLGQQAVEGTRRTYEGVHGGTVLDHEWDQIGTRIRLESRLVRELEQVTELTRGQMKRA